MSTIKPIIKWAGGKRALAPVIASHFGNFNRYYEPFAGGAAVMLELCPRDAVISDANPELINMYQVVKEYPEELCRILATDYVNRTDEASYYEIRNKDREPGYLVDNSKEGKIDRAARFLYLNRTGFNGLYRENSKGQNNVAYGKYKNPCILDMDSIMELSKMLNENRISFSCQRYQDAVKDAGVNDLVYMDPPYDVEEGQSKFTSYTKYGFNRNDQVELKIVADKLLSKGCKVFISNSDTAFIRDLYGNDPRYTIHKVQARRSVGCKTESRKVVTELLIEGKPTFSYFQLVRSHRPYTIVRQVQQRA